ncbi:hypothetical protein [Arcobacter sp.]|uniref:hypothetical protein n=1 Tax=Arcobacter sp. TaxID=1872629 RepID=UPI003D100B4D
MLKDYFEEYKYHIVALFFLFIIMFSFFFFLDSSFEDKNKLILKENNIVQKNIEEDNLQFSQDDKNITSKSDEKEVINKVKTIFKKEEVNKKVLLLSSNTEDNKYSIKLFTKNPLEHLTSNKKYVDLTGNIKGNENQSFFPFFFNEDYLTLTSDLDIEVTNNLTKKVNTCEGSFLDTISPEYSYYMQIDIYDDNIDCFIKSQSESTRTDNSNSFKEEGLVEIKDGVKGIKSDIKIEVKNNEELKKLKIKDVLK